LAPAFLGHNYFSRFVVNLVNLQLPNFEKASELWNSLPNKLQTWVSEGGQGGPCLLDFNIISKKDYFLSFERKKSNFTTDDPPGKI